MPAPAESAARIETFLALEGIPGGSADRWHPDEIEVESFAWGVTTGLSVGGGGGAGRATFDALTVVARSSVASPRLFLSAASGKHHATAVLTVRRKGRGGGTPADFLTVRLTDVVVAGFHQSGDEDRVDDEVSLTFRSFAESYLPQQADGSPGTSVQARWDTISHHEG